ncbi:MAG TPA: 16S rRNA (guanine(527)-N(7))-methyltransferase RsmG [Elusimicrobiota bacterium]|nr:16S rRNA (guanine(527)-N(7))-methyltransferase RsmG [Elusimicrobiota bacterium]
MDNTTKEKQSNSGAADIRQIIQPMGFELEEEQLVCLDKYLVELERANATTNLISYRDKKELVLKHVADSLMLLKDSDIMKTIPAVCLDIGSGGGFPGVPLCIVSKDISVTLLEATHKKTQFLESIIKSVGLGNCHVLWGRAEEFGRDAAHREKYDFVFARALGDLSTVLELALPFLKVGGCLIAHRGHELMREIDAAGAALKELHGQVEEHVSYQLPGLDHERFVVRVRKTAVTPEIYPRRSGMPAKRPL